MPCLVLLDVLLDLARNDAIAVLEAACIGALDDKRLWHLAGGVVGHGDDSDVGDGAVGEQVRLELRRRDLQALYLDELLDAVDDEDVLVPVGGPPHDDLVAGAAEAVDKGLCVCLWVVEVPDHDARRAHEQLARLVVARHLDALDRDDFCLVARQQRARAAEPDVVARRRGHDGARLGHAVALADLPRREERLQLAGRLGAERGGAGEDGADAGEVEGLERLGILGHENDDWGNLGFVHALASASGDGSDLPGSCRDEIEEGRGEGGQAHTRNRVLIL